MDRGQLARSELAGGQLGDARLSHRLEDVAEALGKRPGESLPDAMGDEAALEGAYRLFGNKKVRPEAVLAPHVAQTRKRCEQESRVLVPLDTSEIRMGGDREGLGYLSHEKGRGFLAHVGLAVKCGTREPLGVLHCETVVRDSSRKRGQKRRGPESESQRWHRGVEAVHRQLPNAICVMDREADIFTLVAGMHERSQDFIIRAAQNRTTSEGPLWDLLDDAKVVTSREVELPERKARKRKDEAKLHPARSDHTATLELCAMRVKLKSPHASRNAPSKATYVEVNLVHVIERNPPEGDPPVEWILLTSLPIATSDEVDFIVNSYGARWVIEELFKALKSGCAIEKRQLESFRSMTNLLAISLPIAWLLLRLRHLSRDEPDRPATKLISPLMMTCLRVMLLERTRKHLPSEPTSKELTWAIAAMGGHIKNNGEPGLMVLGRGLAKLLAATEVVGALQRAGEM